MLTINWPQVSTNGTLTPAYLSFWPPHDPAEAVFKRASTRTCGLYIPFSPTV